jgi:rhodanese-related sulfurtransferase
MDRPDERWPQPETNPNPSPLTVDEVKGLLAREEPLTFIDSRNPIAWGSSHGKLPGAIRIAIDDVERHLPSLPRDRRLVVYCT